MIRVNVIRVNHRLCNIGGFIRTERPVEVHTSLVSARYRGILLYLQHLESGSRKFKVILGYLLSFRTTWIE